MYRLHIDIETFSSVDIRKAGLYRYAQAPDFQILLLAYAWGDDLVHIIDLVRDGGAGDHSTIREALRDPNVTKYAYNAAFEWYCLNRAGLTTPLEQWRCTMAHGLYCGYPAGLGSISGALGLAEDKKKMWQGKALINTFCKPCNPTKNNGQRTRTLPHHEPERWELFKSYCMQDVVAEREVHRRLSPWPMPEDEQQLWQLDAEINLCGVAVDPEMMNGALQCASETAERLMSEAVRITGLDNPNSTKQLIKWLDEETDEEIDNLQKDTVSSLLKTTDDEIVRRVLELRQELAKTSTKKYNAMKAAVCDDSRIRGLLQYYGASRTGRWAGRVVQIHNLPRNDMATLGFARELTVKGQTDNLRLVYGNVPDTLSQLIRTAFIPSPGRRFIVADFSAIEARVVAWLADEKWRQEVFATHGKIYEASAAAMFGVPLEKITKGNPEYELRQKGKVAELALGYGGSSGALIAMGALKKGLKEEELPDIVRRWRASNKQITGLWYALAAAAIAAVESGAAQGTNGILLKREADHATETDFLKLRLPNGRELFYARPFIAEGKFGNPALHYYGVNDKKKWEVLQTFGGKLTENVVQAIARDCLAEALKRLHAAGYEINFHVHDEVIIDAPPEQRLEDVLDIMRQPASWAPGLLLNADGFECDYYRKD